MKYCNFSCKSCVALRNTKYETNCCYLRTGKHQQAKPRFSAYRASRVCARRKWEEVEEIVDTASGVKSSREGLDRLMKAVRRGKVDIVVCYKLDRLGRSLRTLPP